MSRPKLLFVVTEDWYFVSHRLALAKAARDAGFDVAVATRVQDKGDTITRAGIELFPIRLKRSTLSPLAAASELRQLRKLYRSVAPDIVHHVALKPIVLGSMAARGLPIKGIVQAVAGLGTFFAATSVKDKILRAPIRAVLNASLKGANTRIIVQNEDDRHEINAARLTDARHISLIAGAGVDLAAFDLPPPPPGPPLVILPARLLTLKGVGEFVEAARSLKRQGINARFALVGAPDRDNSSSVTDAELDAWREEGVVEIWGYRNDMARVLEQATIVCLPTYYREGLPMSLIEAAAARRAIVTTDVPGARQMARGGTAGWVVPPRDAIALADALRDAIQNSDKRQALTDAAYADAVNFYDARRVAEQTIGIYDELLKG